MLLSTDLQILSACQHVECYFMFRCLGNMFLEYLYLFSCSLRVFFFEEYIISSNSSLMMVTENTCHLIVDTLDRSPNRVTWSGILELKYVVFVAQHASNKLTFSRIFNSCMKILQSPTERVTSIETLLSVKVWNTKFSSRDRWQYSTYREPIHIYISTQ